ncbi:hypothetical protein [Winogradskyella ursingii]|uniref:hypothetical protein n=1 Tax=Winogradskyella ursingii TaxID=2686079 RepID=UPI0015CE5B9E|nr:hypothetical protein [Winogradskyella ursingii]
MKTLKITLLLVAVILLTVSGVNPGSNIDTEPTYKENSTNIDLLAHKKSKIKLPTNG